MSTREQFKSSCPRLRFPTWHIPVLAQKGPTRTEEVFSHSETVLDNRVQS